MKDFREWAKANVDAVQAAAEGQPIEYEREGQWRLKTDGDFNMGFKYRRQPKYIQIGEYQVPEPMRKAPPDGTRVYCPLVLQDEVGVIEWTGENYQVRRLELGMCHSTPEAANAHLDALLSFTRIPVNDE